MMRQRRRPNLRHALDCAEQTMLLAVDAVGEVEGVRTAVVAAAPESQGPETARRLSHTGGDRDGAFELVGLGIESVDFTVLEAEIAHQKVAAELAEIVRSDSDAPRSGERGLRAAEDEPNPKGLLSLLYQVEFAVDRPVAPAREGAPMSEMRRREFITQARAP